MCDLCLWELGWVQAVMSGMPPGTAVLQTLRWLSREKIFVLSLAFLPSGKTPVGQRRHNGHVLLLSVASWPDFSLNSQFTQTHRCNHEAPWGHSRNPRAGGLMASGSPGGLRTAVLGGHGSGEGAELECFVPVSICYCSTVQNCQQTAHISHSYIWKLPKSKQR